MKHILLILSLTLFPFWAQGTDADITIEKVFVAMPDSMIPQLEEPWRKDLIGLYKEGKEARLKNLMEGYSKLEEMSDNFIAVQITDRSRIEIKLLPLINNTHIVCLVRTVFGPIADSQLSFFTTDWEPIPNDGMFVPADKEWFYKEDIDRNNPDFLDVQSRLDMNLFRYTLHAKDNDLTIEYTTPLYLGEEERTKASAYLKNAPKIYTWKSYRFE